MDCAAPPPSEPTPGRAEQPQPARRARAPEITAEIKQTWSRRREDFSAGGVAFRPGAEGYEAALIATRGGTRWQLPKGTREPGETLDQTATREVEEEVGLISEVVAGLGPIEYWYWDAYHRTIPDLVHKHVDFFLLRVTGGTLTDTCYEVDATGWFPLAQALELLSFDGEKEVMRSAIALLTTQDNA